MLDRMKLLAELRKIEHVLVSSSGIERSQLQEQWGRIAQDPHIAHKIRAQKWSLLVPEWLGVLGDCVAIQDSSHPYTVLAIDGSQIYYDKHQGPACYLINTGSVLIQYGIQVSSINFNSQPELVLASQHEALDTTVDSVNAYREQQELARAVQESIQYVKTHQEPFVCMLDGSLVFFQLDMQQQDGKQDFFAQYIDSLQQLYEHKVLHVAYMSFPRTKELVNVLRLALADYQESKLQQTASWHGLTDMDVAQLWLEPMMRSIIFKSKAPVTYAYPSHLQPYFCYVHVGSEVVRLEFPAWIAQQLSLVDQICSVVINQVQKGRGYPVALSEAHQNAVVTAMDREFFYMMLKKVYIGHREIYQNSAKSIKKIQMPA